MAIYQIILRSLLCIGMIVAATTAMAQRKETVLRDGWKFTSGGGLDTIDPSQKDYDDKTNKSSPLSRTVKRRRLRRQDAQVPFLGLEKVGTEPPSM